MNIDWDGNGTFSFRRELENGPELGFMAQGLRRERTGLHGRLSISLGGVVLAWSNFNLERDEDRVRLVNSAAGHFKPPVSTAYPKPFLKHEIDLFCRGLDGALLGTVEVEDVAGDAEPSTPRFVLSPYILQSGGTILFGPPGRGKSYITLLMAISLDAGLSTFWKIERPGPVIFVNLERSKESVSRRLGMINRALGLPPTRPIKIVNARGKTLFEIAEQIRKAVHAVKPSCLFLDSISRSGAGDLTDNAPVNKIADLLSSLCPTWFAIGHSPRGDDTHLFGSMMFDAAADLMVQLTGQKGAGESMGVGLQVSKTNDTGVPAPETFALEMHPDFGIVGCRRAREGEFSEIVAAKRMTISDQMEDFLLRHGETDAETLANELGKERANISRILAKDKRFTKGRIVDRRAIYGVVATASTPPEDPDELRF